MAGLLISEVTVKGIVRDRGGFVAMIQGREGKTFLVKPGDKLFDGTRQGDLAGQGDVLAGRERSALAREAARNTQGRSASRRARRIARQLMAIWNDVMPRQTELTAMSWKESNR